MVSDKRVEEAMQIILAAGNARVHCMKALNCAKSGNFEEADDEMKLANKEIVKAHHVQTDAIQEETQGISAEYSVLFAHAQDTLMTIYSEINVVKNLLGIFKNYDERISNLEARLEEKNE